MGVPYCIFKGNARLDHLVHKKPCTTVAFTQINSEDKRALPKPVEANRTNYSDRYEEICPHWGGNILGAKLWFILPSRKRQRLNNWPQNWAKCTLLSFPLYKSNKKLSFKKRRRRNVTHFLTTHFSKRNLTTFLVLAKQTTEDSQKWLITALLEEI